MIDYDVDDYYQTWYTKPQYKQATQEQDVASKIANKEIKETIQEDPKNLQNAKGVYQASAKHGKSYDSMDANYDEAADEEGKVPVIKIKPYKKALDSAKDMLHDVYSFRKEVKQLKETPSKNSAIKALDSQIELEKEMEHNIHGKLVHHDEGYNKHPLKRYGYMTEEEFHNARTHDVVDPNILEAIRRASPLGGYSSAH